MNAIKTILTASALTMSLGYALQVNASVVIGGTRIIYEAKEKEVTVKLSNEGSMPALTQSWVDTGDVNAAAGTIQVPFIVNPPVARIDPGKSQTLRLMHTGEAMPQDKESVFWFNVLEVPPKAQGDANALQMAFRSRVKLFYRPAGLKGNAGEAAQKISWRVVKSGNRNALEATNPTPYHVTFTAVKVVNGAKTAKLEAGDMIGPGEKKVLPLVGDFSQGENTQVIYRFLNDFGGGVSGEATLSQN